MLQFIISRFILQGGNPRECQLPDLRDRLRRREPQDRAASEPGPGLGQDLLQGRHALHQVQQGAGSRSQEARDSGIEELLEGVLKAMI